MSLPSRPRSSPGLHLTGHFLLPHVLLPHGRRMPEARERFFERMKELRQSRRACYDLS